MLMTKDCILLSHRLSWRCEVRLCGLTVLDKMHTANLIKKWHLFVGVGICLWERLCVDATKFTLTLSESSDSNCVSMWAETADRLTATVFCLSCKHHVARSVPSKKAHAFDVAWVNLRLKSWKSFEFQNRTKNDSYSRKWHNTSCFFSDCLDLTDSLYAKINVITDISAFSDRFWNESSVLF